MDVQFIPCDVFCESCCAFDADATCAGCFDCEMHSLCAFVFVCHSPLLVFTPSLVLIVLIV